MNLMTVVICLFMNRPYQSYYFVSLVSFWYLIVYIVLAIPPKVSAAICDANSVAYLYRHNRQIVFVVGCHHMSEVIELFVNP
jgi:hypothetical protein